MRSLNLLCLIVSVLVEGMVSIHAADELSVSLPPAAASPSVLKPGAFAHYVEGFNRGDRELYPQHIKNNAAWEFLRGNIPLLECPDKDIEENYYFRWWTFRKHIKETPEGFIITEFLPPVGWAGKYNSISCAAGHHLREGRWLNDPRYLDDYSVFWFRKGGNPRTYSFWAADSVWARYLVTGDARLPKALLPDLIKNYQAWEGDHRDANGLFWQADGNDGMEVSVSGSQHPHAQGYRATINSYMYGDAQAIANIAGLVGRTDLAGQYRSKAGELKKLVQEKLWDADAQFFKVLPRGENTRLTDVREEHGLTPWYFGLPDPDKSISWKQVMDPQGFYAPFGPTTAEQRHPSFAVSYQGHECQWNGPSWPYATAVTLTAMANLLNDYSQEVVNRKDYFDLLKIYTRSHRLKLDDGRVVPWIDENLNPFTGDWLARTRLKTWKNGTWDPGKGGEERGKDYNHSTYCDLVISGLIGLRPRADNVVEVNPLAPAEWDYFCLDQVRYHGRWLAILWDRTGTRYGKGAGLRVFADGKEIASAPEMRRLRAPLPADTAPAGEVETAGGWRKYEGNPVLGGKLGTVFDLSALKEDEVYRMWISWRPKQSLALVESKDGIHWSDPPRIVLGPEPATGWEDDINRPVVLKRQDGYHLWYTGQAKGHSSIGYATSPDGIVWKRDPKPVLVPKDPWEKVAVMCPHVIWDEQAGLFRMWYSGGEQYEPDAIGYATSPDGLNWTRHSVNPVFQFDPANEWEKHKVTACQVIQRNGWHIMFYIGFRDVDHAQIGIARSRDGVSKWERHPANPIIRPGIDKWDHDACYKPFAVFDGSKWLLWYNGRHGNVEQIGLVVHEGEDLGFTEKTPVVTLRTEFATFAIDNKGALCKLARNTDQVEFLAPNQPAPILSVRVGGKLYLPETAAWDSQSKRLTLRFPEAGVSAVLTVEAKTTHVRLAVEEVQPADRVELVVWGPYPTTIGDIIGEVTGVVRNAEFAVGIQALNAKTLGGYPTKENDIETEYGADDPGRYANLPTELNKEQHFRGDTARGTDFGSVLQAFCRDRSRSRVISNWGHENYLATAYADGGTAGSAIALFASPAAKALETIGSIEIAEGLPHPLLDGVWTKMATNANCSYLIVDFSEQTVDRAIEMTRRAGLKYLYHSSPFETWGHFQLKASLFPNGWDGLRACVEKGRKAGVRIGFHTLSNFITPNDAYVTPKPDPRLAVIGASTLVEGVDSNQKDIAVASSEVFRKPTAMNTVVIGDELIRYSAVSSNAPWRLVDCKRGAWGTQPAAHAAGDRIAKLMDHDYKVFLTDAELSQEVARNIAKLCNHAGTLQISLDGLEGNWSTGMGQYGRTLFTKAWYDALVPELRGQINDASNPGHFNWHIYTRMNWGEPWYAGFRESQTLYRFKNQLHFERNLMPHMLGWFALRPDTSIEDAEWLLARAAGFDAGFALATSLASSAQLEADPKSADAARRFGATLAILEAIKQWETARMAGAFTPGVKAKLRDNSREFHLEPLTGGRWNLFDVHNERFTHDASREENTECIFHNTHAAQPLQYVLRCAGKEPISGLTVEVNGEAVLSEGCTLPPGGSLRYIGGPEASVYDSTWKELSRTPVVTAALRVGTGEQKIRIGCKAEKDSSLKIELRTLSSPEEIATIPH